MIDVGDPNYQVAVAGATHRLSHAGPGATMCVVEVCVGTDNEAGPSGYHVVPLPEWEAFARRVQATAEGMDDLAVGDAYKEVTVEVVTVLRNPVQAPPEYVRHVFMAGRLAKPLHG